jgi:predicted dehydrogenase
MQQPGNLLLVGVGPHAQRFYLPSLAALGPEHGVRLRAVVEVEGNQDTVRSHLAAYGFAEHTQSCLVPRFSETMPEAAAGLLDDLVHRLDIGSVIIATDPLSHKAYALWALRAGLHILLDKPITSRRNAVSSLDQAVGIEDDYLELMESWRRRCAGGADLAFSVCAHRRFHPGILKVIERIESVSRATGCPVTAMHAHHSDGQWRFPNEMVTQDHHAYHQGHGKASHSGHHFFDCIYRFYRAGTSSGKQADAFRVYAGFVQPHGHLAQLGQEDYERLFGPQYLEVRTRSDQELAPLLRDYGELDVAAVITFLHQGTPVCLGNLELLHNGFSRRCFPRPGTDLYKGNGRVKHEQHRIHVGPFLAAHIHSYQAKDDHARSSEADRLPGGNNHFEITFFNNTGMLPGTKPVEHYRLTDLAAFDATRLHIEMVKEGVVREFFQILGGRIPTWSGRSPLSDHAVPVRFLSGVYRSHVLGLSGRNPVVEYPLSLEEPRRAPTPI